MVKPIVEVIVCRSVYIYLWFVMRLRSTTYVYTKSGYKVKLYKV